MDKTEIVNMALTNIGHGRITSLLANNKTTRTVKAVYTPALEDTLSKLDWSFARRQAKLALIRETDEDGVQPFDGWEYLYALPPKCIAPRLVFAQGCAHKATPDNFLECRDSVSNVKAIATDVPEAYCQYTENVVDTSQFDAPFAEALSAKISEKIALDLSGDKQLFAAMAQLAKTKISEAARLNRRRSRPKQTHVSRFISFRS